MMTLDALFNQIKTYGYIKAETVNDSDSGKELKHIEYDRKDGTHVEYDKLCNAEEEKKLDIKATKEQLNEINPVIIKKHNFNDTELEKVYKNLRDGKNKVDGRKVQFVNSVYGKIIAHGKNVKNIIPQLADIFDNSVPLHDSNYVSKNTRSDGTSHKEHPNIKMYHDYLALIKNEGSDYFVRFTVQELKSKIENNQFHDVFVSDVKLYDKKAVDELNLPDSRPSKHLNTAFDKILAQALREIKGKKK